MKTSSIKKVRNMYEANAESYNEMMDQEIKLPVYREVLSRLQENIADIPGSLIDTACGSGHMLAMFQSQFDSARTLLGIDISPRMVTIAKKRLGDSATILEGDMRNLSGIDSGSAAALINFYAIQHLDLEGIRTSMTEWYRVLAVNGHLLIAAWEGSGPVDYGESADIVAMRYSTNELTDLAEQAGFILTRCHVEPVDGFSMDVIYLECIKPKAVKAH